MEYCPAAQGVPIAVQLDDPAAEVEPEAQGVQIDDAVADAAFEYVPAAQSAQGPLPFAEYWPATHGPTA